MLFSHNNTQFAHLLSLLPTINLVQGPWITGGSARKLYDQSDWCKGDVDVFFSSAIQRSAWLAEFDRTWNYTNWRKCDQEPSFTFSKMTDILELRLQPQVPKLVPQATIKMETENAITFDLHYRLPDHTSAPTVKLQIIKVRQAASLQDLWQEFDFDVCCFAADAQYVMCTPEAKQNADHKLLSLNASASNKNLPLRLIKYVSQGFDAPPDQLLEAFERICDGDCEWEQNY